MGRDGVGLLCDSNVPVQAFSSQNPQGFARSQGFVLVHTPRALKLRNGSSLSESIYVCRVIWVGFSGRL